MHLYYHPEWPDIKLAQAALLCGQAADMITAEGLHVDDVPVMLGGDWNSLWRKYRPDVYDTQVRPASLSSSINAFCFACTWKSNLHNPSCVLHEGLFRSCVNCVCFSARLKLAVAITHNSNFMLHALSTHCMTAVIPDCIVLCRFHSRVS